MSSQTTIEAGTIGETLILKADEELRYKSFVLYNQSPFVLSVDTGHVLSICPAFTADVYDVEHSQTATVRVTPVSTIGIDSPLANQIFGTFYRKEETLPFATFPVSLFGSIESLLIDNPIVALDQNLSDGIQQGLPAGISLGAFQSYQAVFSFSNGAASTTNYAQVTITFWADSTLTDVLWTDTIEVNRGSVRTFLNDRLHGPFMTITPDFPGGTLSCLLMLSNRSVDRLKLMEEGGDDRILIVNELTASVAFGANSAWAFAPLFHGPAFVRLSGLAGGVFQFAYGSLGTIWQRRYNARLGEEGFEIILPCRPLRWRVNCDDLDAVNSIYGFSLWARDN